MSASDYVTVANFKTDHGITSSTDDDSIGRCITDASRAIDRICDVEDGHFAVQTFTRYFEVGNASDMDDGNSPTRLIVEDLISVTTLKIDEDGDGVFEATLSAATDYLLYPLNETPKTEVRVNLQSGAYLFPVGQKTVEIVGTWGEAASVPSAIRRAAMIQASRYRWRLKAPEGVAGNAEAGFINLASVDPDVLTILRQGRYMQPVVFA